MKKKMLASIVALSSMSLGIVGVSAGLSGAAVANPTVLTEETNVGVTFTNNFNPVDTSSISTEMALNSLSYEPLIQFDSLKAGVWYPWLATAETFSNGGKTVTFTIRSGAKWSDGSALTAAQVAATFNTINTVSALNVGGLPALASPATSSGQNVVLTYSTPQYSNEVALGSTLIFPTSQFSTAADATKTVANTAVVGDGPFIPTSYSSTVIKYTYNKHFWGTTPYVTEVNIPYIASNQAATEALAAHQLDWAGNDIPQIQSTYLNLDPKHNHYYYAPGSTVTLWMNVGSKAPDVSKDCLADANFRYAVSQAMNRSQLSSIGETGYEPPATSDSGLMPSQAAYQGTYKNDYGNLMGWTSAHVSTFLTSKGYVMGNDGYFKVGAGAASATGLAVGTECYFVVQDPSAYSDYAEDSQLIAATLQSDGIHADAMGVTTGEWYGNYLSGNFDAMVHWGNGGTNPYTQFQNWLDDSALSNGVDSSADYGAYQNASAQTLLSNLAANAVGTAGFQTAVTALSAIMATQVPEAPILYGADWDVYSTARFDGWVTPTNQYGYPGPGQVDLPLILTKLVKAKA